MKKKISVTIEEEILRLLDVELKTGKFRNRSHILEYAMRKLLNGKK